MSYLSKIMTDETTSLESKPETMKHADNYQRLLSIKETLTASTGMESRSVLVKESLKVFANQYNVDLSEKTALESVNILLAEAQKFVPASLRKKA